MQNLPEVGIPRRQQSCKHGDHRGAKLGKQAKAEESVKAEKEKRTWLESCKGKRKVWKPGPFQTDGQQNTKDWKGIVKCHLLEQQGKTKGNTGQHETAHSDQDNGVENEPQHGRIVLEMAVVNDYERG